MRWAQKAGTCHAATTVVVVPEVVIWGDVGIITFAVKSVSVFFRGLLFADPITFGVG